MLKLESSLPKRNRSPWRLNLNRKHSLAPARLMWAGVSFFMNAKTSKARIYFADGHVESFGNQAFAFAIWLALPKALRLAFRGKHDTRPVQKRKAQHATT